MNILHVSGDLKKLTFHEFQTDTGEVAADGG